MDGYGILREGGLPREVAPLNIGDTMPDVHGDRRVTRAQAAAAANGAGAGAQGKHTLPREITIC